MSTDDKRYLDNLKALGARPCMTPFYKARNVKGQLPQFRELREKFHYEGFVDVRVPGANPVSMFTRNDDNVALTYFYYGDGSYESLSLVLFSLLSTRSEHIMDVGAHTGLYSLIAARSNPNATVHYFEVMEPIFQRAKLNGAISGVANRTAYNNFGVSSKPGVLSVNFNENIPLWTGASLETLSDRVSQKGAATSEIEVKTLDQYWADAGKPRVGLMKIDVENHELAVFQGAKEMLTTCTPFLICEVLSKAQLVEFVNVLREFGYSTTYEIDDDALMLRQMDQHLNDRNGVPYQFRTYHNVLFSQSPFGQGFQETLVEALANSPLGKGKLANSIG